MNEHPDDVCKCGARRKAHPVEGCAGWSGRTCFDCPDLDNEIERPPPPWKPRARCCRDEHLDRRAAGDNREWEGIEDARARSDAEVAIDEKLSRQAKRFKRRKATKRKGAKA
jgi:hypothetical protein